MLQQATLDQIREQARTLTPLRTLLTLLASVLYGIGWLAAKTLGTVWTGLTWSYAAVVVGWKSSTGKGS